MKKCLKSMLFLFLFTLTMCAVPVCAKAAAFQDVPLSLSQAYDEGLRDLEKLKIGNKYFWLRDYKLYYSASKTAKGKKIAAEVYGAVTDGKVIYYAVSKPSTTTQKATVYSYTVRKGAKKTFGNVKAYSVIGYAGGKVYLAGWEGDKHKVVKYDLKSKKTSKKFLEYRLDGGSCYANYVTGWKMVFDENGNAIRDLYLHNLVTGKGKCIAKNGAGYNTYMTKNKLYYSQEYYKKEKSGRMSYTGTRIYAYSLKTGKKVAVTKKLKIYTITKLTSSSVTYMQEGTGKVKTVKFS